jgi:hypothetical protein
MNRWWALWLAVWPLGAWPQSGDLTYKGVSLGARIAEYKTKLPDQRCLRTSCMYTQLECLTDGKGGVRSLPEITACYARNSFGGVLVRSANADFRDGKLVEVRFTIPADSFDALTGAVRQRLGKPTKVVDRAVQMRGDATLQNREMIWERPRMILTVQRYSSTIDEGSAVLTTPQERNRKLEAYEAQNKKGAKDF